VSDDQLRAERFALAQVEYAGKIKTAARNSYFKIPSYSADDMEQELLVVLWESVEMYDPDRGATFNTFFWMRARQKIGMLDRHWNGMKMRKATLVSLEVEAVAAAVEDAVEHMSAEDSALLRMEVQKRIEKLSPQERRKLA
jgi:RNA polymerase sigma factor (sigma-70 family)